MSGFGSIFMGLQSNLLVLNTFVRKKYNYCNFNEFNYFQFYYIDIRFTYMINIRMSVLHLTIVLVGLHTRLCDF